MADRATGTNSLRRCVKKDGKTERRKDGILVQEGTRKAGNGGPWRRRRQKTKTYRSRLIGTIQNV